MGDRANIVVISKGETVCLYTHWKGYRLPSILQTALIRGKSRWDDFQYLTEIIFCQMLDGVNPMELKGFGITQNIHDGGRNVINVDVDNQTIQSHSAPPMSFQQYIENGPNWLEGEESSKGQS